MSRLAIRFYDVQDGSIRLDGVDLRDVSLAELRRSVSIVFEDTFLFHDSVAANIAFARPDASHEDVERAARLAGAHDFVVAMPDGYETLLGERGYSLSGGQRQRIAIARAILADPRVLILDDATSAVDPSKEHEIREAMATVMAGRTTIVIAHRPGTIALADTVVLLDEAGSSPAAGTRNCSARASATPRCSPPGRPGRPTATTTGRSTPLPRWNSPDVSPPVTRGAPDVWATRALSDEDSWPRVRPRPSCGVPSTPHGRTTGRCTWRWST